MVGERLGERLSLPAELTWRKGGLRYLGVFLGDETTVKKNWDSVIHKVKSRLNKWRWLLPKMSLRGRVLIANNLVSSSLWHRLACMDPPVSLLSQSLLVDFIWDKMHWVPQSVRFLPKEEGGQGLVHLASRGAAFRLRFCQRLLGPDNIVWTVLARCILKHFNGLGMDFNLFLMDNNTQFKRSSLPSFYKSVFNVWTLLRKRKMEGSRFSALAAARAGPPWDCSGLSGLDGSFLDCSSSGCWGNNSVPGGGVGWASAGGLPRLH